jgi:hypothetical protein
MNRHRNRFDDDDEPPLEYPTAGHAMSQWSSADTAVGTPDATDGALPRGSHATSQSTTDGISVPRTDSPADPVIAQQQDMQDDRDDGLVDLQGAQEPVRPHAARRRSMTMFLGLGVVFLGLLASVGVSIKGMLQTKNPPDSSARLALDSAFGDQGSQAALGADGSALTEPMAPSPEVAQPVAADELRDAPKASASSTESAGEARAVLLALESVLQDMQRSVDRMDARVEAMAADLAAMRQVKSTPPPQASTAVRATQRTTVRVDSKPSSPAPASVARSPTTDRAAREPAQTTTRAHQDQRQLEGMSLRAVYPPSGADSQAWVMDGQVLRVVARGSYIGGARVLEVLADRVITDQGFIR